MKHSFLLFLLLLCSLSLSAAKHPTVSHRYKGESLEQVLKDVAKRTDYQLVYEPADIDGQRPITIVFKDASAKAVLKKLLGKEYIITSKKNIITINRKPEPPTQYQSMAALPSEVVDDSLMTVRVYQDTTYSVSCRNKTIEVTEQREPAAEPQTGKGHYVEALIGGGYCGATAQVQYAYFFHENVGVYAGVGFSGTASFQQAENKTYQKVIDSDGELYDHTVSVDRWRDRYTTHTFDIPVGLQFQYPISEKVGLYAALGAKIGIPVMNRWRTISGTAAHNGYYAYSTHATINGADFQTRDFYTFSASDTKSAQEGHSYKTPVIAAMVSADLGVTIPVTEQIDVMVGAYAQVTCNDQRTTTDALMGWSAPEVENVMEKPYSHAFMRYPEGGIASTEQGKALIPYQVGIKAGIRWHYKPKAKPQTLSSYRQIQICDTTFALTERRDTVMKPRTESAREIKEMMKKAVIWFDLDRTEPKLQPADIIDRIAAILIAHPEQRIYVNGHASKEGNEAHNRRLSERRAEAVYQLLIKAGVPASQIEKRAFSADVDYVVEDNTQHSISLDRRVEIIPIVESDKH